MKTLILGSTHSNTASAYIELGLPQSELVTSSTQEFTVGHTAAGDIASEEELEELMSSCDKVYWSFPEETEFDSRDKFYQHLNWLKEYQYKYKNIVNFNDIAFDPYKWNTLKLKLNPNDAVFLGCSFTEGKGLDNPAMDSYTKLVSDALGLNCVNLGKGASNNFRTFDVLNQLEFLPGQTIVVQLTVPERIRYVNNDLKTNDYVSSLLPPEHVAVSSHYDSIRHTNRLLTQFLRYSREKELKVVFWLIDYKGDSYTTTEQLYYYNMPEFVPPDLIAGYRVDAGTDNMHPGIESQKLIADAIVTHYRRVYEC